jgi:hypothetical protein
MPKRLCYQSGEEIRQGDRVEYAGHAAIIEYVADGTSSESEAGWNLEANGAGVMVVELQPVLFGRLYLTQPELADDLLFVSRAT